MVWLQLILFGVESCQALRATTSPHKVSVADNSDPKFFTRAPSAHSGSAPNMQLVNQWPGCEAMEAEACRAPAGFSLPLLASHVPLRTQPSQRVGRGSRWNRVRVPHSPGWGHSDHPAAQLPQDRRPEWAHSISPAQTGRWRSEVTYRCLVMLVTQNY